MTAKRGAILFDAGNTLIREIDDAQGPMVGWAQLEALPGAAETLARLQPDWTLCVATNALNSDVAQLRAALARVGLAGYFEHVFRGLELGAQKPYPAFFHAILRILGEPVERVLMVGDAFEIDVLGAANVGMRAVWLNERTREVRQDRLWRTIHALGELPDMLEAFMPAAQDNWRMSGAFSDLDFRPNAIEQARRRHAGRYIDLTSSNPTHQGLLFPPDVLRDAAAPFWAGRRYDPDPRGAWPAREAIARYYAERMRGSPSAPGPDGIFITASTSEAYNLLFALLCEPGDNVLGPEVTYPLFEHLAALHHAELRPYRLDEPRRWRIDPHSIQDQHDERSRAILVVSPHNPTGAIVARPIGDGRATPIICDEVFAEFTFAAPRAPAMFELERDRPVFVLNGISKMFALPDLKLGWIALNDVALQRYGDRLELLNDTFLGANALAQHMLPALFERGREFVDAMTTRVRGSLEMALDMLGRSPRVRAEPPDGGYYLFPEVEGWDDDEALTLHALEHGVLVSPGHFFNHAGTTRVMLSCLTEPATLREGLERFTRALSV